MAGSVNKVILIGNVGKDPEIRSTQDGSRIANLTLATSESWTDKASGERKEKTEWHRVSCFNDRTSEIIERFVKKGSKVYIEGALQTRKWTDQQGQERYTTEIVIGRFNGQLTMLSSPDGAAGSNDGGSSASASGSSQASGRQETRQSGGQKGKEYGGPGSDLDDEIPF